MSQQSHNLRLTERREFESHVVKTTPGAQAPGSVANYAEASQLAVECLRLRSCKEWSLDLGLHPRTVQRWTSREAVIPEKWIHKIITASKGYFLDLSKIEQAVDRMILMQLGTNDPGTF